VTVLFHPHGTLAGQERGESVVLGPADAGWEYTGLRVVELEPGVPRGLATGESEFFILPLSGSLEVEVRALVHDGDEVETLFSLVGRASVFDGPTDFVYAGRDSLVRLVSAEGAIVALPSARCGHRHEPRYGPVEEVPVETRGAGPATRYVRNFGAPDAWSHAERLVCCEVLTPPGNWSSYPPHKHDHTKPCEVQNEEIYYFRIAGSDQRTPSREGFGLHGTYTGPEHEEAGLAPIDEQVQVRDGDIFLIPYGYHGPCVAAPGYPMYYLNVMAGPGPDRSMAFCDDPSHAWVRDSWSAT
jgi:5-deoxy-glucuronate isomerase